MDRLYLFMNKKVIEENKQLAEENYKGKFYNELSH